VFAQLLPRQLDSQYRGRKAALWLFGVVILLRAFCAVNSVLFGHFVARVSEGIPATALAAGQDAIVGLLGLRGLSQVMLCVLYLLALTRYRALVPFMFLLVLVEVLGRLVIVQLTPLAPVGTPPATYLHLAVLALSVIGLPLSLWPRASRPARVPVESGRAAEAVGR